MRKAQKLNRPSRSRRNERGMALVSVLLISTLLLTAGGLLLLTTSMATTNTADSASEMQAYYSAEAGLQRTLNVLRSRDIPAGTMPAGQTKLTFRDIALNPALDKWIPFDGPTVDGAKTTLVGTNAYSVAITDPDDQNPIQALKKISINPNYQPARLNIKLTGYGPRRAKKILNMLVARSGLGGFQAPATITLRGSDAAPPPPLALDTGNSNVVRYTGNDAAGGAGISAFAVTVPDVTPTLAGIQRANQVEGPPVSVLGPTSPIPGVPPTKQPDWLNTADDTRAFVSDLKSDAVGQNRYFQTKPDASAMGTAGAPKFTFVDGDVDLGPGNNGTGFLVVTGNVTMRGNTDFNGVIFVLGGGDVHRNGGGNGTISGGIVIAKFGATGGFQAPTFTTNGGGNSRIEYNSTAIGEALSTMPGFQVLGVVEK
ncbi:MAG: hypothetical protein QOH25_1461 [Acidobacteriota bacterium]|jgi:hypothetical protein|nr:hypothetical protein [Acidobacteriota bacterium]